MKKSFYQTRTFFVLFIIYFWPLMFFAIPSEASPKRYKGQSKQENVFRERRVSNLSEQYRIQSSSKSHSLKDTYRMTKKNSKRWKR